MKVQIVSFRCEVKNNLGQFISSSFNQDVVTNSEPNQETILPIFARELKKLKQGQKKEIFLTADQAYGFYDPALVVSVPRSKLLHGKRLKAGDAVQGKIPGELAMRDFIVASCSKNMVSLDGNHPLAGQDLVFNVEMISKRTEIEEDEVDDFTLNKRQASN